MIHIYDIFTITLDDITFFININSLNKSEQFAGKEIIILQEKRLSVCLIYEWLWLWFKFNCPCNSSYQWEGTYGVNDIAEKTITCVHVTK